MKHLSCGQIIPDDISRLKTRRRIAAITGMSYSINCDVLVIGMVHPPGYDNGFGGALSRSKVAENDWHARRILGQIGGRLGQVNDGKISQRYRIKNVNRIGVFYGDGE
jgi:hypothetical protein